MAFALGSLQIACPMCGGKKSPTATTCQKCYFKEVGEEMTKRLLPFQGKRDMAPAWKGGRRPTGDGYIYVFLDPSSPYFSMATKSERVREHRLVMAQKLGRCLESWEIVHHKNGDKTDNRIENLELLPDKTKHRCFTVLQNYVNELEEKITDLSTRLSKYEEVT